MATNTNGEVGETGRTGWSASDADFLATVDSYIDGWFPIGQEEGGSGESGESGESIEAEVTPKLSPSNVTTALETEVPEGERKRFLSWRVSFVLTSLSILCMVLFSHLLHQRLMEPPPTEELPAPEEVPVEEEPLSPKEPPLPEFVHEAEIIYFPVIEPAPEELPSPGFVRIPPEDEPLPPFVPVPIVLPRPQVVSPPPVAPPAVVSPPPAVPPKRLVPPVEELPFPHHMLEDFDLVKEFVEDCEEGRPIRDPNSGFLHGDPQAVNGFYNFVTQHANKMLLQAEPMDEVAREARDWRLYKVHCAALSRVEAELSTKMAFFRVTDSEKQRREVKAQLLSIYNRKREFAVDWLDYHITKNVVPQDQRYLFINILTAYAVHYERLANDMRVTKNSPSTFSRGFVGDPRFVYQTLCKQLAPEDQWIARLML